MEITRRNGTFIFCAFGILVVLNVIYWIPKLENGKVKWVFNSLGVQTAVDQTNEQSNKSGSSVGTSLIKHLDNGSNIPVNSSLINSTVNRLGFLEFQTDSDTLKQLITKDCKDNFLVPPLVHYVWLSKKTMLLHEYVGILSASKFLKPCYILIHGDTIPGGKWWAKLLSEVKNIIHVQRKAPDLIFGKKAGFLEHKADIMRLEILLEYGGIYADTDMYFLKSFDPLRNYEFTLSRESRSTVANGLILTNKESGMLKMWYTTYHSYTSKSWAENSVFMADKLTKYFPDLVHMEPGLILLGSTYESVYKEDIPWNSTRLSVHLYARLFKRRDFEIDEIKQLNNTFGSLTRFILFGKKDRS